MAAKGYGHFRARAGVNRRYSRPRMRANTVLRSSKATFSQPRCVDPMPTMVMGDDRDSVEASSVSTLKPLMRSDVRPLSLDLSDVSDCVDMSLGVTHSNASSLTVCVAEACCRAASEEDLYGWEAELDRKVSSSTIPRRSTPLKRNLLQRVFSLGERSMGSLSRSSTLSDSLDGSPGT
jgi:hypothetical protein